jgi:hypothetical protein
MGKNMKIALSFIGTGKYLNYLPNWYEKVQENFLPGIIKHIFVFTDGDIGECPDNITVIPLEHKEWPYISLERFKTLLSIEDKLLNYDWFIFMDADTLVVNKIIVEDIFDDDKPLIGVHHPCAYLNMPPHNQYPGAFEVDMKSTAAIVDDDDTSVYYQACVWGGKTLEVLEMMKILDKNIQKDLDNEIIADWDDESHLNKYYCSNKKLVNTLSPSYAYPELFSNQCNFKPIIVHLAKNNLEYQL